MDPVDFSRQVTGVSALAEPVRRDLYLFVAAQDGPVTRDEAAAGVDVARHTAKFHLDRLVDDGLLDVDFKRMSGREGPGAGRPTKRYRRVDTEFSVTLPERRYDLAGQLMATAIEDATRSGTSVVDALHEAAAAHGAVIGSRLADRLATDPQHDRSSTAVVATLAEYGYEPHLADGVVELVNCPFHSLAKEHTELVCGMNLAMLEAVVTTSGDRALQARLSPSPGRCCVVLAPVG